MAVIYSLEHPVTGEVKYIGQTRSRLNDRLRAHVNFPKNTLLHAWVSKLKKEGLLPKISKLDTVDQFDAIYFERYWTHQFQSWGFNLLNKNNLNRSMAPKNRRKSVKAENKYILLKKIHGSNKPIPKIKMNVIRPCIKCGNTFTYIFKKKSRVYCGISCSKKGRLNSHEAIKKMAASKHKPIFIKKDNYYKEFNSVSECADFLKIHKSTISNVLNGRGRRVCGYYVNYF